MPKINLTALPRPQRRQDTRTFTDPAQPGIELTLTLQRLDPAELAVALDQASDFYKQYGATGLPLINGTAVPVAEGLAQSLAMIGMMQVAEEEERYSLQELFGLVANMPTAAAQVIQWAMELNGDLAELDAGNASGAASP